MANYFSHYCQLISSAEQLDYCQQAQSLSELLVRIKTLWSCHQFGDDELLREIFYLNQTPVPATTQLAGKWMPYRYQVKQGLVNWLLPKGYATEPFFDEYISRCRQQLFNQIIQPVTSISVTCEQANYLENSEPSGFIFHLSRCGSTLISGCLSELETTCVFSESPLLTELLLDGQLSHQERKKFLQVFIGLQASAFDDRPHQVIKWNAWDIFRWDLIREVYPNVPVIFLVRDPVEILASHHYSAGRHMGGDESLACFHPVFSASYPGDVLDRQIQVLLSLLVEMNRKLSSNIMVVDYQQLNEIRFSNVMELFGIGLNPSAFLKIQERMRFHSKSPGQLFVADKEKKQGCFTFEDREKIRIQLMPAYNQLINVAAKTLGMLKDVH